MYQAQEVAAVIATTATPPPTRRGGRGRLRALPVVVDPFKALLPGAPVLRTDKKDKKDNRIFHWEAGDRAATYQAFASGRRGVKQTCTSAHPRRLDRDLRLRGDLRPRDGEAHRLHDHAGAARHPHGLRAGAGHVGLSEEKIRIVSRTSWRLRRQVPVYPDT